MLAQHREAIRKVLARAREALPIGEIEARTGVPRNFLVLDLEVLREKGEITKEGWKRDAVYSAA